MVFEGAGIRGIAYAGVVEVLEKEQMIHTLEKVGGTSAGAITALMLSLGYTSGEIEEMIGSTRFRKFNQGGFPLLGGIHRLHKSFGWYKSKRFEKWLARIIETKTQNPDITFADLHRLGYKDLFVTGTCLNRQKSLVFSYKNYPQMRVLDAVRISMSIPFYFEAVFIDQNGKVFKKHPEKSGLDILVDGGILQNYPIGIFDSITPSGKRIPNPQTLGIRIDSERQIAYGKTRKELAPYTIQDFNDFTSAFYTLTLESLNRTPLTEADWNRSIVVSSKHIAPKIRKLSAKEKQTLIESGRQSTYAFLHGTNGSIP